MADKIAVPYFAEVTGQTRYAAVAVLGARFVKAHATAGDGNFGVQPCTAGAQAEGVAERDTAIGGSVLVFGGSGTVVPVECSGTITAGDEIASDSVGRAVVASTVSGSSAVAATLNTGVVGSNNAITWTARDAGNAGNGISVTILGSTGNSVSLAVAVAGNDITVTPATNGSGVITSTADDVKTAVAASAAANSFVTTADTGASDGSGVIAAVSATNLAGGADPVTTARVLGIAADDATSGALAPVQLV